MTKPALKATAAKLAEVARKTGGVFVFATRDANLPRGENASAEIAEYPFAEHTCKECATVFSAVTAKDLQNHCIACGSDKVEAKESSKINIPSDNELSYVPCQGCGTNQVFATAVGKEVAAHMHCTTCGETLHKATADAADGDGDGDEDDVLDLDDMEMLDLDDDDDDVEVAEKTSTDNPEAPAQPLAPGAPASGDAPDSPRTDTPPNKDATGPSEPDSTNASAEDEDEEDKDGEDEGEEAKVTAKAECATLDMIDTVGKDDAISFAYMGKQVAMLSGTKIVATLDPEDAGDRKDVLQTQAFIQSVAHVISKEGVKAALEGFGFKTVKIEVPVKAMIDKAVAAATADDKQKVTSALDNVTAQFSQAVDIAAAGYAGNFWRGKQDPVKAALIAELSSLGIPNAQKVVDRVFAANGVAQMRDVIALARELSNKAPEALNALAQAIDLSKYQPTKVKAADEDEDGDDDDEAFDDEEATLTVATAIEEEPQAHKQIAGIRVKDPTLASLLKDGPLFN